MTDIQKIWDQLAKVSKVDPPTEAEKKAESERQPCNLHNCVCGLPHTRSPKPLPNWGPLDW